MQIKSYISKHLLSYLGGVLLLDLVLLCVYAFWLRPEVSSFLQNGSDHWLRPWVALFYPRFFSEYNRFSDAYFLQLADQVLVRLLLAQLVLLLCWLFSKHTTVSWAEDGLKYARFYIRCFALIGLLYAYDWIYSFYRLSFHASYYDPLSFLVLFPSFSFGWLVSLWVFWLLSSLYCLWRARGSLLPALLFIVLQAYLYSFGKLDHTYAPYTYVCLLIPFYERSLHQPVVGTALSWLQSMRWAIALCYVQAGLEKLMLGGWGWLDATHLRTYLWVHQRPAGLWLIEHSPSHLLLVFSLLVMLWQLSFIGVLWRRWRWLFLLGGVLFHLVNYIFLGIGWYWHSYVWCYVFFLNPRELGRWLRLYFE